MARRDRVDNRERRLESPPQGSFLSPGFLGVATLVGVAVLLIINVSLLARTSSIQEKVDTFESRLSSMGRNVDTLAKNAQAPRQPQGPDPNKVYTVKTQGSPVEGPESAAVTIAEFSDFQ